MKHSEIIRRIEENPIIAAIKDEKDLDEAIASQVSTIFLLHADIFNIKNLVDRVKDAGKSVMIHIDFLEGIGKDNRAVDYICDIIKPHGIISTRNNHIRYSIEKGMFTIQRVFLIDSMSYDNSVKTAQTIKPDMIEVMPGLMPNILKRISGQLPMPIIAGGLIETKEDIIDVLNSGALAASTGKKDLWSL
jgi:glycerol uptake operon antiterminator